MRSEHRRFHALCIALSAVVALAACSDAPSAPDAGPSHISINTDATALSGYVRYVDSESLAVDPVGGEGAPARPMLAAAPPSFTLTLKAEVASPVVNGRTLEATHVVADAKYAYVTYGASGEESVGAIASFDISNPDRPKLLSLASLPTSDVNAIAMGSTKIYLAEATSDAGFAERAVLEELTVLKGVIQPVSRRVGLPSYAATGVSLYSGFIFVTSGSGGSGSGGVTVLDVSRLAALWSDIFLDARAMSIAPLSRTAVALQGSQGRLRVYDATNYLAGPYTIDIGGASIPSSKGTLEILNDWVFASAGEGGAKIVSISGRRVIASLPRPVEADVDPADAVSNAVTVDGDLVFVANGGAGVYVASKQGNGTGMNPNLTLLGKIRFSGRVSANYVASKSGMLFVAAGLGGLKIIRVN